MIAYDWSHGRFGGVQQFSANDDGYREFELYLQKSAFRPAHILVDLIEEEFHPTTAPHAWGSDRVAVLDRTMKKYFRTSELRSLQVQKRQKGGRRDLEVLISGLGNATILRRWIDILERTRVPVKGIYSLPLVGQSLLANLKVDKKQVLLVSQQSPMTLRQSFYDSGFLKLSRLALHRMARDSNISDINFVKTDVNNTLQYLRSQRLLRRSEPLEVLVVVRDELFESFDRGLRGEELVTYSILRQSDVAKKIGVKGELPTNFTDGLFAHTLLKKTKTANHYAPRSLTRFYRYHVVRKLLLAAAGLVLVIGGAFSVSRYYEVQLLHRYTSEARIQKKLYRRYYRERVGQAKAYQLAPDAVKSAVNVINLLEGYSRVTPLRSLSSLAEVLTRNDKIEVTRVNWLIHPQPEFDIGSYTVRPRSAIRRKSGDDGLDYEIVEVAGKVVAYANNYRHAVEVFESFVEDIRETSQYSYVRVEKTPFDIDSKAGLAGDTGTATNKNLTTRSTFELRLTLNQIDSRQGQ